MVNYSSPSSSKGYSIPIFMPGQTASVQPFVSMFKPILAGDVTSPIARTLSNLSLSTAVQEGSKYLRQILGTPGITEPAKAELARKGTETTVTGAAGAPTEVWKSAFDVLNQYIFGAPDTLSYSKAHGGSGVGVCCYVICASDPTDEMLAYVRAYKDAHYHISSNVARGYKRLATWLVPLMLKYPLFKRFIRFVMVAPMEKYARAFYEKDRFTLLSLTPIAKFWVATYWSVGNFYGLTEWTDYWKLHNLFEREVR